MGGAAKAINPHNILRGAAAAATMGTSEALQAHPFGLFKNPTGLGILGRNALQPYAPSPFSIDPAQIEADQASINQLGDKQRADTSGFAIQDATSRTAARQAMSDALTKQSQAYFNQSLPQTEETLNAQHLLNGSGLGQELGRQQGYLATNIANQMGVQGANDLNRTSDINLGGLQGQQALQQGALSRGFSLQDFGRQAQLAQAIGAQSAPQVGSGKGETGTLLGGIGGLAPLAGLFMGGPAGAAAGTVASNVMGTGGGPTFPLRPNLSMFRNNFGYNRYS